jgi:hypothetical protein
VPPSQHELEQLLVNARPAPRPEFVRELERSLQPSRRPARRPRLRVALAGVGVAGALAGAAAVAGIVGVLPGSSGSPHGATAKPRCERVLVDRRIRQPYFVHDRKGVLHVRYRVVTEPRLVTRCR